MDSRSVADVRTSQNNNNAAYQQSAVAFTRGSLPEAADLRLDGGDSPPVAASSNQIVFRELIPISFFAFEWSLEQSDDE